jgi:hypothetical protein
MFIESVPNRDSPPAVLLRESYRDENGRPQKRTLANLSKLPDHVIAALKAILKGGTLIGRGPDHLQIERSPKKPPSAMPMAIASTALAALSTILPP